MSELYEDLETLAEHSSPRVNGKCARQFREPGRFNTIWQISPSLERASAARDGKKAIAKPKPQKSKPAPVAIREPATPAEIFSYDDLLHALRQRADELEISRETISALAGVQEGYAQKVLSLNKTRRIGMETFGAFLDALPVKLVLVEDPAAQDRNLSRYKPRDDAHFRSAKAGHDPTRSLIRWAAARGLTVTVLGADGVEKPLEAEAPPRKRRRRAA